MFPLKKVSEVKVAPTEQPKIVVEKEPEMEPETHFDTQAVTEQSTVFHNRFGTGVVTQIADGKIYVEFGGQQRIFQYPDAFDNGWLTIYF